MLGVGADRTGVFSLVCFVGDVDLGVWVDGGAGGGVFVDILRETDGGFGSVVFALTRACGVADGDPHAGGMVVSPVGDILCAEGGGGDLDELAFGVGSLVVLYE